MSVWAEERAMTCASIIAILAPEGRRQRISEILNVLGWLESRPAES